MRRRLGRGARWLAGPATMRVPAVRQAARTGLTVFVLHDVTDRPSPFSVASGLAVGTDLFARQLGWIARHFEVVHPDDLLAGRSAPAAGAMVTFDDGFASVLETALPILELHGIPAVAFLNLGVAAGELNAAAVVRYVAELDGTAPDWAAARPRGVEHLEHRLAAAGRLDDVRGYQGRYAPLAAWAGVDGHPLLCLGNHLWNHWYGPALDRGEFEEAYGRNADALAGLRSARPWLAFTYGVRTEPLGAWARQAGASRLFTGGGVVNPSADAILLHRIDLSNRITSRRELLGAVGIRSALGRTTDLVGRPAISR